MSLTVCFLELRRNTKIHDISSPSSVPPALIPLSSLSRFQPTEDSHIDRPATVMVTMMWQHRPSYGEDAELDISVFKRHRHGHSSSLPSSHPYYPARHHMSCLLSYRCALFIRFLTFFFSPPYVQDHCRNSRSLQLKEGPTDDKAQA